ncbi:hypothetical protein ACFY8X_39190 [Streptomyces tanashiensis]|uniref:hypothetical protein n=1 Tax=Streptomyces tanashiensis TaxID=67367 RepID=UPI0036E4FE69
MSHRTGAGQGGIRFGPVDTRWRPSVDRNETGTAGRERDPGGMNREFRRKSAAAMDVFAADGAKPKSVLRDAVNNDVEIVSNADNCLVFTEPLSPYGLTWGEMVPWWAGRQQAAPNDRRTAHALYARLAASLDSEPERLLFPTYCARYGAARGDELPVLIPQVYLHYDPSTRRTPGHTSALARQRMDFLLLTPDRSRIVIEVDGVQHYADATGKASPGLYSEMVAEDRRLRLMGYDIYGFGGHELAGPDASTMLHSFLGELLYGTSGAALVVVTLCRRSPVWGSRNAGRWCPTLHSAIRSAPERSRRRFSR